MFDHNIKDIGLYTRPSTQGAELDLVEDFIEYYIHNFLKSNKTNNLAIFVEPKVASGFPDIVFASYSPKTVSYTHLRAHETPEHLVCRLLI